MAKKKNNPAEVVKSLARRAAPQKATPKLFDAMMWCGAIPELAGNSLKIQRKMRDEWEDRRMICYAGSPRDRGFQKVVGLIEVRMV